MVKYYCDLCGSETEYEHIRLLSIVKEGRPTMAEKEICEGMNVGFKVRIKGRVTKIVYSCGKCGHAQEEVVDDV